jgi:hypothetical protein
LKKGDYWGRIGDMAKKENLVERLKGFRIDRDPEVEARKLALVKELFEALLNKDLIATIYQNLAMPRQKEIETDLCDLDLPKLHYVLVLKLTRVDSVGKRGDKGGFKPLLLTKRIFVRSGADDITPWDAEGIDYPPSWGRKNFSACSYKQIDNDYGDGLLVEEEIGDPTELDGVFVDHIEEILLVLAKLAGIQD